MVATPQGHKRINPAARPPPQKGGGRLFALASPTFSTKPPSMLPSKLSGVI